MTTRILTIEAKHQQNAADCASLKDFTYKESEETNPELVVDNPAISLYCLDDKAKQAIFTELPSGVDLSRSSFVYQTQYDQAKRLIAVPYDTFLRLSHDLPEIRHLILIYISGRSGSTLLNHIFNELETVLSLPEPDAATQIGLLRKAEGNKDATLRELLQSTVRFLFKPTPFKQPSTYALKFKAEGVQAMDLYHATFPHAKNLFLYRDAVGWAASVVRIFRTLQMPERLPLSVWLPFFEKRFRTDCNDLIAQLGGEGAELSVPQAATFWWLATMDWYLSQYQQGVPVLGVRYRDLNSHREEVVGAIFKYCGLPTSKVGQALKAFERDAQEGTNFARENPAVGNRLRLTDQQVAAIHAVLQHHLVIRAPDFIAPGTLQV